MTDWTIQKDKMARKIVNELYEKGMILTWMSDPTHPGGWKLKSGLWSPFYINLRLLPSHPMLMKTVGLAMSVMIQEECGHLDRLVGVAMAGIPIADVISYQANIPSCYTRKLENVNTLDDLEVAIKKYGSHSIIEGVLENNDKIAIVDDLVTKFDSKLIAFQQVYHEIANRKLTGMECKEVLVLFDREQGAVDEARSHKKNLRALIPFKSKGLQWLKDSFSEIEHDVISGYLDNPDKYQDESTIKDLEELARGTRA